MARGQIKILDENHLDDATSLGQWRRLLGLKPPFRLMVRVSTLGTVPTTISHTFTADWGIGDENADQADITDSATDLNAPAALTAAGVGMGTNDTSQEPVWIRGRCVTTYAVPNDGQRVEMWVVGDRD